MHPLAGRRLLHDTSVAAVLPVDMLEPLLAPQLPLLAWLQLVLARLLPLLAEMVPALSEGRSSVWAAVVPRVG